MGDPQEGLITVERRETWRFPLTTPANYYIVLFNNIKLLVDSGTEPLRDNDIDYILLTHWHWDHTFGITGLKNKIICSSQSTLHTLSSIDNVMERVLMPLRAMGIDPYTAGSNGLLIKEFFNKIKEIYLNIINALDRNEVYPFENCPLPDAIPVKFQKCPGHTLDHSCIQLNKYIFVGDNATIGESPTTIDYGAYMETVLRILGRVWQHLGPGHGPMRNRVEAVEYFNSIIARKNKRLILTATNLQEGEVLFNDLLYRVYGLRPSPQAYVPARTLAGYLKVLEDIGIVTVDRSREPWIVARN